MHGIALTFVCLFISSVSWFGQTSYGEVTTGKNTRAAAQLEKIARPFKGLVPGQSTKQDVERVLGQAVKKVSETLYEYAWHDVAYQSCGKVFVQYRQQSNVVERIEVLCESNYKDNESVRKYPSVVQSDPKAFELHFNCLDLMVQPIAAAASHRYPTPETTRDEGKGTDKERRLEYYGKPHYAVQTLILKNGEAVSCRIGFYSVELYEAALAKAKGQ